MAAADNTLRNWQLFVDGRGLAGNATNFQPPTLAEKVELLEGGGLDSGINIPIGQEPMEASFTLTKFDPDVLSLWGIAAERSVGFVARGSAQGLNSAAVPIIHTMRGRIRSVEPGAWERGLVSNNYTLDLTYYKLTVGGRLIHEIDVENMVRVINGVDSLAQHRVNIGL